MITKFYIAGQYENILLIDVLRRYIENEFKNNMICVSSWLNTSFEKIDEKNIGESFNSDFNDIAKCDFMLGTYPSGISTTTELGYALGCKIPIIYFVPKTFAVSSEDNMDKIPSPRIPPMVMSKLDFWSSNMEFKYGWIVTTLDELVECLVHVRKMLIVKRIKKENNIGV